jgi:hypothetical protein
MRNRRQTPWAGAPVAMNTCVLVLVCGGKPHADAALVTARERKNGRRPSALQSGQIAIVSDWHE